MEPYIWNLDLRSRTEQLGGRPLTTTDAGNEYLVVEGSSLSVSACKEGTGRDLLGREEVAWQER